MRKTVILTLIALTSFAAEWTGTISDAGCGAKHAAATEKDMKCVQGCVKGKGAEPVFVVGDKVLKFDQASKPKVMEHLGHKVTITGKLEGDTISVDQIKM